VNAAERYAAIASLLESGDLLPVELEGVVAHATPEFLAGLDKVPVEPRVVFVAPLDQFMWDRKMVAHLFDFDYIWEIYTPEAKRRWGYYVLPVLFGDALVARAEFRSRGGVLELRRWHTEAIGLTPDFFPEFERALAAFMRYCGATEVQVDPSVEPVIRALAEGVRPV
jgi:uncharacterized protein YcaQ